MTERLDPYELVEDDEWEVAVDGFEVKMISRTHRHHNRGRASSNAPRAPREDRRVA
jgi:hypothetical protein